MSGREDAAMEMHVVNCILILEYHNPNLALLQVFGC